jgi:hypothetical protein
MCVQTSNSLTLTDRSDKRDRLRSSCPDSTAPDIWWPCRPAAGMRALLLRYYTSACITHTAFHIVSCTFCDHRICSTTHLCNRRTRTANTCHCDDRNTIFVSSRRYRTRHDSVHRIRPYTALHKRLRLGTSAHICIIITGDTTFKPASWSVRPSEVCTFENVRPRKFAPLEMATTYSAVAVCVRHFVRTPTGT